LEYSGGDRRPVTEFARFGFGTYRLADPDECVENVQRALEVGYRHVDTAQGYGNEADVGRAIGGSPVPREEVFVATKLSTGNLAYDDAVETAKESAERLGVETIDLLYVHWPINTYDPDETLLALDRLHEEGVIAHVGLSNFTPALLREAADELSAPVFAHQVEAHPLLPQRELRALAREDDHWLVAYSPIARNEVADVPAVRAVAQKHDATPAQVSLAWLLSKERVAPIPKASGDHVAENAAALDLDLDPEDVERIDGIDRRHRVVDPDVAPWNR
jgi:diketogulonate reductase-like aldo/keto reductase